MRGDRGGGRRAGSDGPSGLFGGFLLAIETAGKEGSAALAICQGGDPVGLEIRARTSLRAEEEHAALLVPRIQGLMGDVGADWEELSGIVVGAGPGSFTGVRVAAATAKGLARALSLPLWAFSSLAAAAVGEGPVRGRAADDPRSPVGDRTDPAPTFFLDGSLPRCVLFDARGDRVYAAVYRLAGRGLETILEPRAATVGEMINGLLPPGALLMGEGALRHRALLENAGHAVVAPPFGNPTAIGLIRLLSLQPETPPLDDPGRWEPEYLRASGAERMWKTRKGMEG